MMNQLTKIIMLIASVAIITTGCQSVPDAP